MAYRRAKEQAIGEVLGISATRYDQLLNELIDSPEALKFDPGARQAAARPAGAAPAHAVAAAG